jgi:hypothetical protein
MTATTTAMTTNPGITLGPINPGVSSRDVHSTAISANDLSVSDRQGNDMEL